MTYQIILSDGTPLTTIADGTLDTTTSLSLVGKNYPGYGSVIANDLVHLLENAANFFPPATPLVGQFWYDISVANRPLMKVWNGLIWAPVTAVTSVLGYTGAITVAQLVSAGMAPLLSPAFVGVPTGPTANIGVSNNQLATTAFVQLQISPLVTGVSSVLGFTGAVTAANLTGVNGQTGYLAPTVSPVLIGVPTAPTAATGTATLQLATTAFVANSFAAFATSLIDIGIASEWDSSVSIGQAVFYNSTSQTYQLATANNDLQAPVGLCGPNYILITAGNTYTASMPIYVKGAQYYLDPLNPGNLTTVAGNAHVGFAIETTTLMVYNLPLLNFTAATNATVYASGGDAIIGLNRPDQPVDNKLYQFRATTGPMLTLSLVNDAGTVLTDVMRLTRAATSVVTLDFLTPAMRLFNGYLLLGQWGTANPQSTLYFADNSAAITGYISQVAGASLIISPAGTGVGQMTLDTAGDLTVAGSITTTSGNVQSIDGGMFGAALYIRNDSAKSLCFQPLDGSTNTAYIQCNHTNNHLDFVNGTGGSMSLDTAGNLTTTSNITANGTVTGATVIGTGYVYADTLCVRNNSDKTIYFQNQADTVNAAYINMRASDSYFYLANGAAWMGIDPHGNFTATGAITATTSISAGGPISSTGNVTANSGRLRATYGATAATGGNGTDVDCAVLLGDVATLLAGSGGAGTGGTTTSATGYGALYTYIMANGSGASISGAVISGSQLGYYQVSQSSGEAGGDNQYNFVSSGLAGSWTCMATGGDSLIAAGVPIPCLYQRTA